MAQYRTTVCCALWVQFTLIIACYLPLGVLALMSINNLTSTVSLAWLISGTLIFVNSTALNPILYCWRIKGLRRAVVKIVRQMFCLAIWAFPVTNGLKQAYVNSCSDALQNVSLGHAYYDCQDRIPVGFRTDSGLFNLRRLKPLNIKYHQVRQQQIVESCRISPVPLQRWRRPSSESTSWFADDCSLNANTANNAAWNGLLNVILKLWQFRPYHHQKIRGRV